MKNTIIAFRATMNQLAKEHMSGITWDEYQTLCKDAIAAGYELHQNYDFMTKEECAERLDKLFKYVNIFDQDAAKLVRIKYADRIKFACITNKTVTSDEYKAENKAKTANAKRLESYRAKLNELKNENDKAEVENPLTGMMEQWTRAQVQAAVEQLEAAVDCQTKKLKEMQDEAGNKFKDIVPLLTGVDLDTSTRMLKAAYKKDGMPKKIEATAAGRKALENVVVDIIEAHKRRTIAEIELDNAMVAASRKIAKKDNAKKDKKEETTENK